MDFAILMQPGNAMVFFRNGQPDPAEVPPKWKLLEGATLDPDSYLGLGEWPEGTESPEQPLCVSIKDPKIYKIYKYNKEIDLSNFCPTGINYGGCYVYTKEFWAKFLDYRDTLLADLSVPDNDPPEAMDEILRELGVRR